MFDYRRSHRCNALNISHKGQEVTLSGWVHRRRDHGGLIFIDLRDRFGITQLLFDPKKSEKAHALASKLRAEWVISAKGIVIPRKDGAVNKKLPTGEIEVEVMELAILSESKTPPFSICDEEIDVNDELRLKYRFLDIRRGKIASNLVLRNQVMKITRDYLCGQDFLEIFTPILGRSSLEGAREFLVPSRIHTGSFYALPQSPQLYKQLLMISGMDRYFQIAPCFRDEDLRADRQPEFAQIDLEMSFGMPDDLIKIMEGLFAKLFKEYLGIEVPTPFPTMRYQDCLEFYGCDKPDTRFGMRLIRVDEIARKSDFSIFKNALEQGGVIKAICVKKGSDLSRKEIEAYAEFVKPFGLQGLAWMKCEKEGLSSSIVKFFSLELQKRLMESLEAEEGDLLLFGAGDVSIVNQSLDHLRRALAKDRNLIDDSLFNFLWVREFPLFQWDAQENRFFSVTHPFTAPDPKDVEHLEKSPLKVRSLAYDLVLNGYEIGGGSQRIHAKPLQEKIYKILGLTQERIDTMFGFFSEALEYGTPPHLGIAFGLDRILMVLSKTDNIRDVIAFPKTQKASDLMTESPSKVEKKQLNELHIKVIE